MKARKEEKHDFWIEMDRDMTKEKRTLLKPLKLKKNPTI